MPNRKSKYQYFSKSREVPQLDFFLLMFTHSGFKKRAAIWQERLSFREEFVWFRLELD